MKKFFQQRTHRGINFQFIGLPDTDAFKIEAYTGLGSAIESSYDKNLYGAAHLVEHLSFKSPRDYTSEELEKKLNFLGNHNASTYYNMVKYWFRTTSENMNDAINMVANITLNDLSRLTDEEFELEKSVVINEARMYEDNTQQAFWTSSFAKLFGRHDEDTVIGVPDTITTFTKEDAIRVKNDLIAKAPIVINIVFDPMCLSQEEIMAEVCDQFESFGYTAPDTEFYHYKDCPHAFENATIPSKATQSLTMVGMRIPLTHDTPFLNNTAVDILSMLADSSLNNLVRVKHGLTYGIGCFTLESGIDDTPYLVTGCDVETGKEPLLMELIEKSINDVPSEVTEEFFNEVIKKKKIARVLSRTNLNSYNSIFANVLYGEISADAVNDDLNTDLEKLFDEQVTYDGIKNILETIKDTFNSNKYVVMSNY